MSLSPRNLPVHERVLRAYDHLLGSPKIVWISDTRLLGFMGFVIMVFCILGILGFVFFFLQFLIFDILQFWDSGNLEFRVFGFIGF